MNFKKDKSITPKKSHTLISYKKIIVDIERRVKTRTVKVDCNFSIINMWLATNEDRKDTFHQNFQIKIKMKMKIVMIIQKTQQ